MRGSFRSDARATSDLPLRLFAGAVVSATLLAVAFGASESLANQAAQRWAKEVVADLQSSVEGLLLRPGSSDTFRFEPSGGAPHARLRLELLDGKAGPLRGVIEDAGGALAAAVLCTSCSVQWDGFAGSALVVEGPATLRLSSPSPGQLVIGTVAP
jgi:hypothetical protein